MSSNSLNPFREIWLLDFEFNQVPGNLPIVRCMVSKELRSGRTIRLWADQLSRLTAPPFGTGSDILFIAYYATAELNCFIALGWQLPCCVLDLFVEFRNMTNGHRPIGGNGLIGAMLYHQLDAISVVEKDEMRALALRGGSYTESEKLALLDYCESDVIALEKLLPRMLPKIDLPRALHRGRYMKAVAQMEANGIPIDVVVQDRLQDNWESIKGRLVQAIDKDYGVFDGTRCPENHDDETKRKPRKRGMRAGTYSAVNDCPVLLLRPRLTDFVDPVQVPLRFSTDREHIFW